MKHWIQILTFPTQIPYTKLPYDCHHQYGNVDPNLSLISSSSNALIAILVWPWFISQSFIINNVILYEFPFFRLYFLNIFWMIISNLLHMTVFFSLWYVNITVYSKIKLQLITIYMFVDTSFWVQITCQ